MAAWLCSVGCGTDSDPEESAMAAQSADSTETTSPAASPERPSGPETDEETIARLNQLPAYEDRTEPYPHTDSLILTNEMFPADIRERYESLFHIPIPEYVVGLRGVFTVRESERIGSYWLFNIPEPHLEDFRSHLIDDLGVPEKALTEALYAAPHSFHGRRDMDPRDVEFSQWLEESWAAADGGLRFWWSSMTQADHPSVPIAKGSPTLNFENHANSVTYPQMEVDLNSGQVIVHEKLVRPD